MNARRAVTWMLFGVAVAIGCGKSPGASATDDAVSVSETPVQLVDAPVNAAPAAGGAAVTGTVKLSGAAPAASAVKMSADPVCQSQHSAPVMSEEVVAGPTGGLKNVFVYVKTGAPPSASAPATPVTLDQHGCWYTPHVFGIQVNQPLEILNSDGTLHNVNAKPAANQPFNVAQPVKGMKTTKKFAKPEIGVKFKCNVHPWMSAYAGVVDHPYYAVSGEDGAFSIPGLPDGAYTLEAWHEKYGAQEKPLTVSGGAAPPVEFTFTAQ